MEQNFGTIDSLNELREKIDNLISTQKQIEIKKKYDEYQNTIVLIDKHHNGLKFKIKIQDLVNHYLFI